jgi:MFS transporter, DHA1 family, solute carrier family 18 (vesicular amine transporter), member 1/2
VIARFAPRSRISVLLVVVLALFTDMLLYTLVIPILPVYAASLGASVTAISILFAMYSVALLVITPLAGAVSDRIGRRRPMLVGLVGLALSTVMFALAGDYATLLIARMLQGVAAAVTWSAGLAMIADAFDPPSRGWAMGVAMAGVSAGSFLGPPLGGYLYELGGYPLPFLVATAMVVIDGLARALLIEAPPAAWQPPRTTMWGLLGRPEARLMALAVAVAAGALGALEPTLPLFLEGELHLGAGMVGFLFAGATLAFAVTSPLSAILAARWGVKRPMMIGLVVLGAALMPIGFLPSLPAQALLMAVMGIANGLTITPSLTGLADVVERDADEAFGVAFALFNAAYGVGLVVGPPAGGLMTDLGGFPTAMLMAGSLPLLFGLIIIVRR